MRRKDNDKKLDELLQDSKNRFGYNDLSAKYRELEKRATELEEKLDNIDETFGVLLVRYGERIRRTIDKRVDQCINDIGMGILRKLVDGGFVNFKEEDDGSDN